MATSAQLRTAAKIAKEYGVTIRLEPDGSATVSPSGEGPEQPLQDELDRWSAKTDLAPPPKPWVDQFLELDPNQRKILSGGYLWDYDDFKADIVKKPLNKREIAALEVMSKFGVDAPADFRQIKIGIDTQERLVARGFIETRPQEKFPDRTGYYILTPNGLQAWEALNA